MSTKLIVNDKNELMEVPEKQGAGHPAVVTIAARIISWVFHPVFVPVYVVYFLVFVHPYMFIGFPEKAKVLSVMLAAVVSFTLFPLITVGLLKALKFIDSIYLRTQKDRVIPLIACMTWYFWIAYVWSNFGKTQASIDMPHEAVQFAMAAFISTVIGLMVNIKMKVSLHAISIGLVVAFFTSMAFSQDINSGNYLVVVYLAAGLVCTARFIVSDHTPAEIYGGLLTGIVSMLLGIQLESLLNN